MTNPIKGAGMPSCPIDPTADTSLVIYRFTCSDIIRLGRPSTLEVRFLGRSMRKHIMIDFKYPPTKYPPDGYLSLCQSNYSVDAVSGSQILEHYIDLLMLAILLLAKQARN